MAYGRLPHGQTNTAGKAAAVSLKMGDVVLFQGDSITEAGGLLIDRRDPGL